MPIAVIEADGICRAGRALFAGAKGPVFDSELPGAAPFDIVHAASVIQYIEDWRSLTRGLPLMAPVI